MSSYKTSRDYEVGDYITDSCGNWSIVTKVVACSNPNYPFLHLKNEYGTMEVINDNAASERMFICVHNLISKSELREESEFDKTQQEFQAYFRRNSKEDYLEYQQNLLAKCIDLSQKKNADYTGATDDAFANFRNSEIVGVSVEKGMLVRLMDKISRVKSFIDKGELMVKDESVEDTIMDIINYACLLGGYINETKDGDTIF